MLHAIGRVNPVDGVMLGEGAASRGRKKTPAWRLATAGHFAQHPGVLDVLSCRGGELGIRSGQRHSGRLASSEWAISRPCCYGRRNSAVAATDVEDLFGELARGQRRVDLRSRHGVDQHAVDQ